MSYTVVRNVRFQRVFYLWQIIMFFFLYSIQHCLVSNLNVSNFMCSTVVEHYIERVAVSAK